MNVHHKLLNFTLSDSLCEIAHNRYTSILVLTQCPFLSVDIVKILKNTNNGPKYFIFSYLHILIPSNAQHFYKADCLKKHFST